MDFLFSKPTAQAVVAAAVRLPQPGACSLALKSTSFSAKVPQAPAAPIDKRSRQRADRSRYQAHCRQAMSF